MLKSLIFIEVLFALLILSARGLAAEPTAHAEINRFLDGFHVDASKANFDGYFNRFASNGYFLGTDASERWSVSAFKLYAKPHFDKGRGWTYLPVERNIEREGDFAWFDEQLDNERLGRCRGTGVLIKENGEWKVLHYSLTFLITNSIAAEVGALTMKALP